MQISNIKRQIRRWWTPQHTIVQLFINDGNIQCRYSIVNFVSLLAPMYAEPIKFEVVLFDAQGRRCFTEDINLDCFESTEIFLTGDNYPPLGLLGLRIKNSTFLRKEHKLLEQLFPHFYTMFSDPKKGSMGLIHPQSTLNPTTNGVSFESNMLIQMASCRKVVAYQINPTRNHKANTIKSHAIDGAVISQHDCLIEPYGVCAVDIPIEQDCWLSVDTLTAPNTKPILFMYNDDGVFTAAHS